MCAMYKSATCAMYKQNVLTCKLISKKQQPIPWYG